MNNDAEPQWQRMQQVVVSQLVALVTRRQNSSTSTVPISLSNIQVPELSREEDDIPTLKLHFTHIWIFIHNLKDKDMKKNADQRQFSKMYAKSKFMQNRFSVHIDRLPSILEELNRKLDMTIKCYIQAQLVTNEVLWQQIKPCLQREYIGEIVVKGGSKLTSTGLEKLTCESVFQREFRYSDRYSGYVEKFDDALQLQKKLLNLALSKSKPNFFIINQYETIEATQNLHTFHDILINTKAYLMQCFDIKTKEMVLKSFSSFRQYIYNELEEFLILEGKKQKEEEVDQIKQRELKILNPFFKDVEYIINNLYPFSNISIEEQFYHKILLMYSQQSIVYQSVNNLCKTITSKEIFMKIAFFCKFLNLAIKYKGKKTISHNSVKRYSQIYRGAMMSQIQVQSLKKLIGKDGYILNLAFLSASIDKQVANNFKNRNRNSILIKITINKLFWDSTLSQNEPYCNYLQYFIDFNLAGVGLQGKNNEQEVLFNCYNVFKVIGFHQQDKYTKVLQLEAFSHLQIIHKKVQGEPITQVEQKILDVIVRVEKGRDYAQQLKQQGKTKEMVAYLEKVVENGVDLNVNQAESYIKFMIEKGQDGIVEEFIEKIEEKAEDDINKQMDRQMKLAVFETIKQSYLQSQLHLESINKKLEQEQQAKRKQTTYKRQSWQDLMNKINFKFSIAVNKEKIGAYQDFIILVDDIFEEIEPQLIASEFVENIEVWKKIYNTIKSLQGERYMDQLMKKYSEFQQLYTEIQKDYKQKPAMQALNKKIVEFMSIEMQRNFFACILKNQKAKKKIFVIEQNQLRKGIDTYKNCFYSHHKLKVNILIYYYQILIKSQKRQVLKPKQEKKQGKQSGFLQTLFGRYFSTNKIYFESLHYVFKQQKNIKYKYQKAIFLKQYGKFLNGLAFFSTTDSYMRRLQLDAALKYFNQARQILTEIYTEHEQIVNIQNTQDTINQQRLFADKIYKNSAIYRSLHGSDSVEIVTNNEQIISFVQSLKKSRFQSAKMYKSKNSILNENLCYSSILNTTIQIAQKSLTNIEVKEKYFYDFQKLANRVSSNMSQSVYLKQHTSNAFNNYLRAAFEFFKGYYEASMVYIGQSEEILDIKLKSTQKRISEQQDLMKKIELENKLKTIKQNNEVRIKISLLKSKICINYKPNIHNLCISNLNDQQKFIRQRLFQSNSALPQIYYYKAYLKYLQERKEINELQYAFKILIPKSRENSNYALKKQLLKYYELRYYIGSKSDRLQAQSKIQALAKHHKITIENANKIALDTIEQFQIYVLFKIEQLALSKSFSLFLLLQKRLKSIDPSFKLELNQLYGSNSIIKLLFSPQNLKYWQAVDKIINTKLQARILVSHKLFLFYFLYLQHLIFTCNNQTIANIYSKLDELILKLQAIVEDSQNNKIRFQIERKNNSGFEDKMKMILLHVYKFAQENWSPASRILQGEIYQNDFRKLRDRFFRR